MALITDTTRRIDYALEYLHQHAATIHAAAVTLGIPLEEALCSAVRAALSRPASDDHQPKLFDEESDT